jgi:carbamoyl-phosphate synthase large subunit
LESSLYGSGSDHPDVAYLMPYPGVGPDALAERLETIRKRENLAFIIPCLDLEIPNFLAISPKLREWGIQCALPTKSSFEARSKPNLYEFCRQINVPSPKTKAAMDPSVLERVAEEIGYPVYVKGRFYEAHIAYSKQELIEVSRNISRVWGWPLLVQEVIVGEEYDIAGLGDGDGGIVKACTIRKFQRSSTGKGFAGIVVEDPELERIAQRIINQLRWNGPFELEFLKALGKPHALFEINPRFPAWIDFPSQIGCNLPGRLLEGLMGTKQTPLRTCAAGQMFVRHCIDLVGDIAELAEMASAGERAIAPSKTQFETTQ